MRRVQRVIIGCTQDTGIAWLHAVRARVPALKHTAIVLLTATDRPQERDNATILETARAVVSGWPVCDIHLFSTYGHPVGAALALARRQHAALVILSTTARTSANQRDLPCPLVWVASTNE